MATITLRTAHASDDTRDILSMQHVRAFDDGAISVEMPYFKQLAGAQSVVLIMDRSEALELAARLVTTVLQKL
jgi:hypothetical protein